jgi:lactate permease
MAQSITAGLWFLGVLPLVVLLFGMLKLKWSAPKAGGVAWLVAMIVGFTAFGGNITGLTLANAKGFSLTIFVVLIIWTSVLLYNVVENAGAMKVIGNSMTRLVREPLLQLLLLAWCVSGFIQGITGFGVPVALVTPMMLSAGFDPVTAAVATLVGHAWSVSFGSMGSSYYTLQLVTKLPEADASFWMGLTFVIPTILTGFAVAHIWGGMKAIKKGALVIFIIGASMALTQWAVPVLGAPQIGAMMAGIVGIVVTLVISRLGIYKGDSATVAGPAVHEPMTFNKAFAPYYVLLVLVAFSQVPAIKLATKTWQFALNFPEAKTALGFLVKAEKGYAPVNLITHPAPLLLATSIAAIVIFLASGHLNSTGVKKAMASTYKQCITTTLSIATMVMMALVMNDTGMTSTLARGVAAVTQQAFPLFSPFIGLLGCFMTGSNTNSNVLFGAFQVETAVTLGISTRIMASVQSCGASLGSAIAPAKVLLGATTVGLAGKEDTVMKKSIPYCILLVLALGVTAWLGCYVFFPNLL